MGYKEIKFECTFSEICFDCLSSFLYFLTDSLVLDLISCPLHDPSTFRFFSELNVMGVADCLCIFGLSCPIRECWLTPALGFFSLQNILFLGFFLLSWSFARRWLLLKIITLLNLIFFIYPRFPLISW